MNCFLRVILSPSLRTKDEKVEHGRRRERKLTFSFPPFSLSHVLPPAEIKKKNVHNTTTAPRLSHSADSTPRRRQTKRNKRKRWYPGLTLKESDHEARGEERRSNDDPSSPGDLLDGEDCKDGTRASGRRSASNSEKVARRSM